MPRTTSASTIERVVGIGSGTSGVSERIDGETGRSDVKLHETEEGGREPSSLVADGERAGLGGQPADAHGCAGAQDLPAYLEMLT